MALLALGIVAELGLALHVGGNRVVALPWRLTAELPLFNNILPVRFSVYVALAAAVAAALWAASPRVSQRVRVALIGVAVVSLLPAVSNDHWRTTPTRPALFADDSYRTCLRTKETVFIPDPAGMDATLWQAESDYRFRLANGNLGAFVPEGIPDREIAWQVLYNTVPDSGGDAVVRLARGLEATVIMLDAEHLEQWGPPLEDAGLRPIETGGVWLYFLSPAPAACA